jgi:hypothetical protein
MPERTAVTHEPSRASSSATSPNSSTALAGDADPSPDRGRRVWRPITLGIVIAERRLRLVRRRKPTRAVRVRFGRPLRAPRAERKDPWWCPVEITGLGRRRLRSIAGEDSLQALVLAFQFVTLTLPAEADRAGGRIDWLGERESVVFANTQLLTMTSKALDNLVDGLTEAVRVLESGGVRRAAFTKVTRRLRALVASGGYTSDHRRVPKPSNNALKADAPRRRAAQRGTWW